MPTAPPVTLTIAGADCSCGAGIQADLKTFAYHGTYGLSALSCVVTEMPGCVERIDPVPPEALAAQIRLLLEGFPVTAVKTGMLLSADHVRQTLLSLDDYLTSGKNPKNWLVVDPVMIASSGDPLLQPDTLALYKKDLIHAADLVTPNLNEAAFLLGREIPTRAAFGDAAEELADLFGTAVLLKGGHLEGAEATDILVHPGGTETYSAPFVPNVDTHGTGCTYSAAITARLAHADNLPEAVGRAKAFVTAAISRHFRWGKMDALNHSPHPHPDRT